jgi:hypothetical protein
VRIFLLAALLLPGLAAAGCGSGEPGTGEPPAVTVPRLDPSQLLEGNGTVLDDGGGPELCLGGVAESYPPQCGGIPLAGWDWDAVDGEESASGTTWGDFHVLGTYDGETFTVTEAGPPVPDEGSWGAVRDFTSLCPEPSGGWVAEDPGKAGEEAFGAGAAIAQDLPGYVTLWVTYAEDLPPEELDERALAGDPVLEIMNVVVAEDAAGAEAAIREAWGGPLCVTERQVPTEEELMAIRTEAERFIAEELGLEWTWSQEGDVGLAAEVGVVVDPGGAGQAALDALYGQDMIKLFPALRPVEE